MAQYNSNIRNRFAGLSKMFAGLVLTASTLATISPVWGQYAGESRWSAANPPTPSLVDQANIPDDDQLRRLPPIDEVSPPNQPSAPTTPPTAVAKQEEKIAANPQNTAARAVTAPPVDWSNPSVVIGPEARMVSHEEVVAAPRSRPSRYSEEPATQVEMPAAHAGSRFTQAPAAAPVTQQTEPSAKSENSVFARVFDESENHVEKPVMPEANAPQPVGEVAAVDSDLSPIFACRLLGLPATKAEQTTPR